MEGTGQPIPVHPGSGSHTRWRKLDEASYTHVGVAKTSDSVRLYNLGKWSKQQGGRSALATELGS